MLCLIVLLLVSNVVRVHNLKVQTGMEGLIGTRDGVKGDMNRKGYVFVAGELWQARCEQPLQDGEEVRIVGYEGLTLFVKPIAYASVSGKQMRFVYLGVWPR